MMCLVVPFMLDVRLVDAPVGVTQEEGNTGFLHLPSAVLALFFLSRRGFSRPFPSSTVKSNMVYPRINHSPPVERKIPVRVTVPRFELTSQRQKVSSYQLKRTNGATGTKYVHVCMYVWSSHM